MEDVNNPEAWAAVEGASSEPLNMAEMADLVRKSVKAWEKHDRAEELKKKRYARATELDNKIMAALKAANLSKFHVDGVGCMGIRNKMSVTVPKSMEDKVALLNYFKTFGPEVYFDKVSVNSQTLNSWYNQEFEKAQKDGTALGFNIPGVAAPTVRETLAFTKEKVK